MKFTVVLSADPESGVVTGTCPAMPGLVCEATTFEDASQIAADLILTFLELGQEPLAETGNLIAAEVSLAIDDRQEEGWPVDIRVVTINVAASKAA